MGFALKRDSRIRRHEPEFAHQYLDPVAKVRREEWRAKRLALEKGGCHSTPLGIRKGGGNPFVNRALVVLDVLLRTTGLIHVGVRNALDVRIRKIEVAFDDLPEAFCGYTILHLSDLHIDALPDMFNAIVGVASGHRPDLCVMTGDFLYHEKGPFEHVIAPVSELVSQIQSVDGVYVVLGNHDSCDLGLALEGRTGVRLLANERVRINRGTDAITLSGVDDVNRFYTHEARHTLAEPVDGFGIALVHSPEMTSVASAGGHSLYLCGHTHGGQIALPNGMPVVTRMDRDRSLARGQWRVGDMVGHTNNGVGVSGPPVRFFTRGEVVLLTLRRKR